MSEIEERERRAQLRPWARRLLALIGFLGVFFGFLAWAVSSPVGSSPDEDYHLGSIWCPSPVEKTGCVYNHDDPIGPSIQIPETVRGAAACTAFNATLTGDCVDELSDEKMVSGYRFDGGHNYPYGYFQFQHLFVGHDVERSVLAMRIVNIVIGLGSIAAVLALSNTAMRRNAIVAASVAWVPMGVYYISSVNPSSWAISGLFIYSLAILSASMSEGWRRWCLMALAAVGVTLSVTSRGDSAFYVLVVSIAALMIVPVERKRLPEIGFALAASIVGLIVMLSTGQAANMTSSADWPATDDMGLIQIFAANALSIPEFVANLWGLKWGPGWLDTPILGWTSLGMLFVAGGAFFIGAKDLYPRKVLASIVAAGGLLGIPVVSMTLRRVQPISNYYQPRYLLPLLAVFFLLWMLSRDGGMLLPNSPRLWLFVGLVSTANFFALRQVLLRYTVGINGNALNGLFKFFGVEWSPWSLPPLAILWGGSASFALGLIALFLSTPKTKASDPT